MKCQHCKILQCWHLHLRKLGRENDVRWHNWADQLHNKTRIICTIVKDRNGRSYRRRAGESENKLVRYGRTFYGCFFAQSLCVIIVLVSNQKMIKILHKIYWRFKARLEILICSNLCLKFNYALWLCYPKHAKRCVAWYGNEKLDVVKLAGAEGLN